MASLDKGIGGDGRKALRCRLWELPVPWSPDSQGAILSAAPDVVMGCVSDASQRIGFLAEAAEQ